MIIFARNSDSFIHNTDFKKIEFTQVFVKKKKKKNHGCYSKLQPHNKTSKKNHGCCSKLQPQNKTPNKCL